MQVIHHGSNMTNQRKTATQLISHDGTLTYFSSTNVAMSMHHLDLLLLPLDR